MTLARVTHPQLPQPCRELWRQRRIDCPACSTGNEREQLKQPRHSEVTTRRALGRARRATIHVHSTHPQRQQDFPRTTLGAPGTFSASHGSSKALQNMHAKPFGLSHCNRPTLRAVGQPTHMVMSASSSAAGWSSNDSTSRCDVRYKPRARVASPLDRADGLRRKRFARRGCVLTFQRCSNASY